MSEQPGDEPGGAQDTPARTGSGGAESGEPPDAGVWGASKNSQRPIAMVLAVGCGLAVAAFAVGMVAAGTNDSAMLFDPSHASWKLPRPDLAAGLTAMDPGAYFQVGIVAVMATPVVALVGTLAHYAQRRQWQFAGAAGVVLTTICVSLLVNLNF